MRDILRRLVKTSAAYQAADIVSKAIALILLPIYTRHLTPADYGTAELLLTTVIFVSIVVRFGIGEAFVRFHFHDSSDEHRLKVARTATAFVFLTSTAVSIAIAVFAKPISELLLGHSDATILQIAALGLWAFTNLELAYALLRVEERARTYLIASLVNVALTVVLTVWLVVFRNEEAAGLLAGNYVASAVVLVGLWWVLRHRLGIGTRSTYSLGSMLRFGLPTVPAEVSVFALNVIDRFYLYRDKSEAAAGLFSLAVKLAALVVIAVRGFQSAWPPLAYSIEREDEAADVYSRITTYYVLFCGFAVALLTLLGRYALDLLPSSYAGAFPAIPWVALGWALYGLFLVLVVTAGRSNTTTRNAPAALIGLVVNVVLLVTLVPPLGIAGAGIALCGAYVAMLIAMYFFARSLFPVSFEWRRLTQLVVVIGGLTVAGELLLPTDDLLGFVLRLAALLLIPFVLLLTRFLRPEESRALRGLVSAKKSRLSSYK